MNRCIIDSLQHACDAQEEVSGDVETGGLKCWVKFPGEIAKKS